MIKVLQDCNSLLIFVVQTKGKTFKNKDHENYRLKPNNKRIESTYLE